MKRLFNTRKKTEEEVGEQGNTLDRIVKDKEGVKKRLEEEEKSFMNKKREYERKMIDFEKQVVGWVGSNCATLFYPEFDCKLLEYCYR